jgi:hypothetical protein
MSRSTTSIAALVGWLAFATAPGRSLAMAPDSPSPTWSEVKCARYTKAWSELLARRGTQGLGQEFVASHEAFLASGCTARADVCPRSAEELDVANIMVVMAMNAGTASTFPPFACRR